MIVWRRWAIVSTVHLLKADRIVFWRSWSVSLSTLLVASSSIKIFDFLMRDRAMHNSCLCPTDKLLPPSEMTESSPFLSCKLLMTSFIPLSLSASQISASSFASLKGSRFDLTVPEKMTGSWGTRDSFVRRSKRDIWQMSRPSMQILPPEGSTIRYSAIIMVDLPDPVLPQTPTFSQPSISKVSPFRTHGSSGLYFTTTFSNEMAPFWGQLGDTSLYNELFELPSEGSLSYSVNLSTLFMFTSSSVTCLTIHVISEVTFMADVIARPDMPAEWAEYTAESNAQKYVMLDPRNSSLTDNHRLELTRGQ
mmetsp:Transcript_14946/g.37994  ORF Transcript_14946/g.37994 Transcript_14946/m.37994 type:complete len:307 (-) Transcript_14946:1332-2252(-)